MIETIMVEEQPKMVLARLFLRWPVRRPEGLQQMQKVCRGDFLPQFVLRVLREHRGNWLHKWEVTAFRFKTNLLHMTISPSTPSQSDVGLGGVLFWSADPRRMGVGKSFYTGSYLIIFVVQGWNRFTKQKLSHVSLKNFQLQFFLFLSISDRM